MLAQQLPGTGRLALQALLEKARTPTWRLWARESTIETKDFLKNRGYIWSPGEFGRPRSWYRDVSDAGKTAEVAWLRANVIEPDQAVWALRFTARDRYSDRCWGWGEPLAEPAVQHWMPTFPNRPRASPPGALIPFEDAIDRFPVVVGIVDVEMSSEMLSRLPQSPLGRHLGFRQGGNRARPRCSHMAP
jgi:hypothetical protein